MTAPPPDPGLAAIISERHQPGLLRPPPQPRRPPPGRPHRPPVRPDPGDFGKAWQASDIAALVALLDPDAVITADGGGQATAARHPIEGAGQISRYLAGIAAHTPDLTIIERTVNGQPGLIAQRGGTTVTVLAFGIEGDRIARIWAIRNPDKLRAWLPRADLIAEILREQRAAAALPLRNANRPILSCPAG